VPASVSSPLRVTLGAAVVRAGMGAPAGRVSGLSAAAKALWIAAFVGRGHAAASAVSAGGGRVPASAASCAIVVVPSDRDVEQMAGDIRFFLSALEEPAHGTSRASVFPFPSHETDPYRGLPPHLRVVSARARALSAAATGQARVVVASAAALLPRVSAPSRLRSSAITLTAGADVDPEILTELLADAGFSREDPADEHGEFCRRGGVVDIFPVGDAQPIRLEFLGDTIESMRRYDPTTQRSTAAVQTIVIEPLRDTFEIAGGGDRLDRTATLFDFLPGATRLVSEEEAVVAAASKLVEQIWGSYSDAVARGAVVDPPEAIALDLDSFRARLEPAARLEELAIEDEDESSPTVHIACQGAVEYRGRVADWAASIRQAHQAGDGVVIVAASPGRAERIVEILRDYEVPSAELLHAPGGSGDAASTGPAVQAPTPRPAPGAALSPQAAGAASPILVTTGVLSRGFRLAAAHLQLFAETDLFEEERRAAERRPAPARAFLSDFRDLKVGDHVVHVDHGIGLFVGLKPLRVDAVSEDVQEFLELRYAGEDKLFVPIERLDLVQKYSGGASPSLDRLGGTTWERAKTRVKKAMRDMAEELLKLYAARKAIAGHAFGPDTHWQQEFEEAFEYDLTPDQASAIADIRGDMESATPMDRLLCGDVGYGKTEVAMRAAFKAVMDGKQVAFLAPTTVLAFQHLRTLNERFAAFPVAIDMVSRFRSRAEQKQVLAGLVAGKVDVIVGTHRLLSKDVVFRDLGLLVVDEEQRFGVAHKERLKQLRRKVDVLTMTATPIPRTLNMSLVGIRDMSVIETPPKDRLSIQTNVVKFDQRVIGRAIRSELDRGGQIYFVHNRVESIFSIANLVARLVPDARLVIGHGQMDEEALERAMVDFVAHKYDVLVATTIVENGLDIPNVNTIIINRADRYGLAQLYQLRGRVGRSDRPAYAYLLIPPEEGLSAVARKRLAAIKEFSDLGSGFRVAALDLEIRGAGNLLGGEQSGHIEAVGFEMYVKLLEQAIRELKGEELEEETRATVNLGVDLRVSETYVPDMRQRLALYRRVAAARAELEIDRLLEEARDRYGPLPGSILNLADHGRLRIMADRLGIDSIDRQGGAVVLRFRERPGAGPAFDAGRMVRFLRSRPDVQLVPPGTLRLDLKARPAGGARRSVPGASASWWTARATTGRVIPGFSRDAILRNAREDPRAAGGVFERVGGLLSAMLDQV